MRPTDNDDHSDNIKGGGLSSFGATGGGPEQENNIFGITRSKLFEN
jgi:hypothetical protein